VRNQQTLAARIEEKDQEVNNLKEQMGKMKDLVEELNHAISSPCSIVK
jgi:cell division protein FtsB